MTETMVVQYQRWLLEKYKVEFVSTLREWINIESELQMIANEAVHGIEYVMMRQTNILEKIIKEKALLRNHFTASREAIQIQMIKANRDINQNSVAHVMADMQYGRVINLKTCLFPKDGNWQNTKTCVFAASMTRIRV